MNVLNLFQVIVSYSCKSRRRRNITNVLNLHECSSNSGTSRA